MRLAIGSDEQTFLTQRVIDTLKAQGYDLLLIGPLDGVDRPWPVVARDVAEAVVDGKADEGILFCWTGTGVSIAANKIPGIRAALCADAETARGARRWNDANVLCLSLRKLSEAITKEIIDAWFSAAYESNPEDDACLAQIGEIEREFSRKI
ncbi:MAG: RpiB/LacA/LacB family sugar-phosphate isomerase [Anaerolineales bacterium]|nr:RpiB/LacA/LacB family sugar-phosphate isomerase [Anaerolineales bacterium]MCK5634440.1 RpiB/LacA/LacB family sugar-phosphate isomerase [Anaerolineales bacterium]